MPDLDRPRGAARRMPSPPKSIEAFATASSLVSNANVVRKRRGRLRVLGLAVVAMIVLGGAGLAMQAPDAEPASMLEPGLSGSASTLALLDRLRASALRADADAVDATEPEPEPTPEPEPKPALEPKPEPNLERAPLPPPPGREAGRAAWLAYAQAVAERRTELAGALVGASGGPVISDEFGRTVGEASYPDEEETDLKIRLSAIVDPHGREPFAIIEHRATGVVASYREGAVLPPGALPGVWVVDVEPGVVHLLDLENNSFEYLTFAKPPKLSARARRAQQQRERARRQANRKKRR